MSLTPVLTESALTSTEDSVAIVEDDLHRLMTWHGQLAHLCDQLEACADRLPTWPNEMEAEWLQEALQAYIERGADRKDPFVACTVGRALQDPLARVLIKHINLRHANDQIHAQDLIAALSLSPTANRRASAETLGYMLRCFFAASRQTMVLEELAILVLDHDRLTPSGKSLLIESLCQRAV